MYKIISKLKYTFHLYIWPGLGLFGESFLLFSIGTIRPFWNILYPQCFNGITCSNTLLNSLTYSVVIGIIIGMVSIGILANKIGRRNGSITTATFMTMGSIGLALTSFVYNNDGDMMLHHLVTSLFIFGIGVGGEYPLSSSSASERAMNEIQNRIDEPKEEDENYIINEEVFEEQNQCQMRGKRVILVFSMQGLGIFVNTLVITILLFVTGQWGYDDNNNANHDDYYIAGNYNINSLLLIWQAVYVLGATVLIYVLISRILYLKESAIWAKDKQQRQQDINENTNRGNNDYNLELEEDIFIEYKDMKRQQLKENFFQELSKTRLFLRYYWHRLFGTSLSWLLWDVAFYGNKLFQSSFLFALTGKNATLLEISSVALLNAFVALLGYFVAAALIDKPTIGRFRLQQYGFLLTGTLFCLCGYFKDNLSTVWLIIIYLGSSFFGQCGPNCTTFIIPAEIFPTEMRTSCHGISAASGKIGALIAATMFNHLSESSMFSISGYCSFLACLITFITIPESASLDLRHNDKKWRSILVGDEYEGIANESKYLSSWERWTATRK